ncbi:unnamed protein product [Dibothriocephalus latus]|uniref:Uncharacterized protein n=1 Tax=Dibothriocephalus latus TaxID=60516 RepID=A0A3P7LBK6_DIBLA|nr:unnamed protein product [Dibothriocephalus latus]
MSAHDRKAELEQKKLKLAALREGRLKREGKLNDLVHSNFKVNATPAGDAEAILRDFGLLGPLDLNGKPKVDEPEIHERPKKLTVHKVNPVNIIPHEIVTYSKNTQTALEPICETPSVTMDTWTAATPLPHMGSPKGMTSLEWDDDILEALPYDDVGPLHGEGAHFFKNYDVNTPSKFFRSESPPNPPFCIVDLSCRLDTVEDCRLACG